MNYKNKWCLVTGSRGFIGSALVEKLRSFGACVMEFDGDVTKIEDFDQYNTHNLDYVFHFGSPSSQILFERNQEYCTNTTLQGFLNCAKLTKTCNAKLIYPSTGLVAQNRLNEYSRCKRILEDLHKSMQIYALGLRIYAGYGEGEGHKGDYASPIYLFARDMVAGKSPVIWGDGTQTRDFIYIEDLVNSILEMSQTEDGIREIGCGKSVSFNQIIKIISKYCSVSIRLIYIEKPKNYYNNTKCKNPIKVRVSLEEGIKRVCKSLL